MVTIGNKEFFKGIDKINFEGKNSKNPFAFKYYNPDQLVAGKSMREHFIHLDLELKVFHGINLMIHYNLQKTRQMQLLSLYLKWDLIIFVFMILI